MRRVAAVWAPADVGAAALCALPIAVAGVLAFHSGGYLIASWGIAAVVLLAALAAAALACERDWGGGPGTVALAGWAGLAAWQGLSAMWADEPAAATRAMGLTALYGAAFLLPLIALRRVSWLARIGDGACLVCAIVAGYAVCARLLPGVVGGDDGGRLSTPITYWNALGLLLAFGAVLALSRAGDPGRTLPVRAAAAASGPLLLLGILFTLSRGAVLALAVGVVVLLWLVPSRLETLAAAAVIGGISAPLIVAANARADLTSFGVLPPHAADGHHIALMLTVAMAVAAIAAPAVVAAVRAMGKPQRRGVGWALALLAVAGVAIAIAVGPPQGHPAAWAQRELNSFRSYDPGARAQASSVAGRLAVAAGSGRWQQWTVATEELRSAPVLGTGAGDYRFWWDARRPIQQWVQNAHSLYLETLGESGLVGLLLLLAPACAVLFAVFRALRRASLDPPLRRELAAVAAAGVTVGVHLAGDWDWQLPAVVVPALVLGGAALKTAALSTGRARRVPRGMPLLLAGAAAVLLLLVAGPTASARRVEDAKALARASRFSSALVLAQEAVQRDPQSPDPFALEGNLFADLGRPAAASAAFAAALERSPRDWTILADWAAARLRAGDADSAKLLVRRALPLDPREPRLLQLAQTVGLTP